MWDDFSDLVVYHALQIRRGLLHHMWLSRDVLVSVIILIAPAVSVIFHSSLSCSDE